VKTWFLNVLSQTGHFLCRYAWEAEEENIVNRLQTQMLELYQRNKFLERRLEAGGCTS
jgi:hypothetical protein